MKRDSDYVAELETTGEEGATVPTFREGFLGSLAIQHS
jgi:hypothetical protein